MSNQPRSRAGLYDSERPSVSCLQQMESATTISDGEDEEDDVFDMSEQLPVSSRRRQRSAKAHTAGPGQHGHASHRPATAPTGPQQRSAGMLGSVLGTVSVA